jgi:hypothetical protein
MSNGRNPKGGGYGSVVEEARSPVLPATLELPAPAIDPNDPQFATSKPTRPDDTVSTKARTMGSGKAADKESRMLASPSSLLSRCSSAPDQPFESFRRMFSRADVRPDHISPDSATDARLRETEFFDFLDGELAKIESFYKVKEADASERLAALEGQLHLMHDARMEELKFKRTPTGDDEEEDTYQNIELASTVDGSAISGKPNKLHIPDLSVNGRLDKMDDGRRDYVRRQGAPDVPYRLAKRKLKLALLEFYRGLELLKSYADMNRKAFRKMNKKYDKVASARPSGRYMSEKVNKAWFVQSEVIENYLSTVEELYTRYFEQGNRKAAVGKLRGRSSRAHDYSSNAFRNGLMLALGLVFGVQGLLDAIKRLDDEDDMVRVRTSYLLQVCLFRLKPRKYNLLDI